MNPYDDQSDPPGMTRSTIELPGLPRSSRGRRRAAAGVALAAVLAAGTTGFVALNERQDAGDPLQAAPRAAGQAAPPPAAAPGAAPGDAPVTAQLQWTTADAVGGLGWATDIAVGDDGSVYALSTAPGAHDPNEEWKAEPSTLYTSADGREWSAAGVPADLWASSLEAANGRLYAVGTAPASAAEGERTNLQVASSSDGGVTWSNTDLPLDITGLKDRYGDQVSAGPARLAAAPSGALLATTTVHAWADPYDLLPADVDQRWGIVQTATGFDVYGPPADLAAAGALVCETEWVLQEDAPAGAGVPPAAEGGWAVVEKQVGADVAAVPSVAGGYAAAPDDLWCVSPDGSQAQPVWAGEVAGPVARSFTWDELGVDSEFQALMSGQAHVFFATDGATFEEVAADLPGDLRVSQLIPLATPDGFMLLANLEPLVLDSKDGPVSPTVIALSSTDGRTWADHPAGELTGWVRNAGVVGDTVAVVFDAMTGTGERGVESTTQVATSTAGSAWTITSPSDLVQPGSGGSYVGDVAVGPLGIVALVGAASDPIVDQGGVDVAAEAGGFTLRLTNQMGAGQLLDANGAVVAETASIHDNRDGDAFSWDHSYTTLTVTDPATGTTLATFTTEAIDQVLYVRDGGSSTAWTAVHSADGVNWTAQPVAELVGGEPSYPSVVVSSTAVVVRASFPTEELDVPARQVVAVGTPG